MPCVKDFLVQFHSLGIVVLLLLANAVGGFVPTRSWKYPSIPSNISQYHGKTNTINRSPLFGKRKANGMPLRESHSISSILRSLPFPKTSKRKTIESGLVETALVLGNKQRRDQWIKDASMKFWWIPPKTLSTCTDGLASAFCAVAPRDLKDALKPGGLDSIRAKVAKKMVYNLKEQPIVKNLPLPRDDKNKLVEYLVDLSLDFFLRDLEQTLAAPSTKLAALDREKQEILQYMSFRDIAWYNLKYKPKSTIGWGLFSLWSVGITVWFVQQNRNSILIGIQQIAASLFTGIHEFLSLSLSFLSGKVFQGLSYGKSFVLKNTKQRISWLR